MSKLVTGVFLFLLSLSSSQPAAIIHRFQQNQIATREQIRKDHSKLYKGYGSGNLRELAAKANEGDEVFLSQVCAMGAVMPDAPPFDLYRFLTGLGCEADVIVSGVITDKTSFLTEDEQYVFTDYTLTVEEVFKDDLAAPIELHSDIVVTRPCGTITLDGRKVGVTDVRLGLFDNGRRYVLFLKAIRSTGTYSALRSQSGFELRDDRVFKTTEEFAGIESENDASYFLNELRIAASGPCKDSKRQ